MKDNYNLEHYGSIDEKLADILTDIRADLVSSCVSHKSTGEIGTITEIDHISLSPSGLAGQNVDFIATVSFGNSGTIKKYALLRALSACLDADEETLSKVKSYIPVLEELFTETQRISAETHRLEDLERQRAKELRLAKEKELKDAIRREAKIKRDLERLSTAKPMNLSKMSNFYSALGWMAGHVSSISAQMPDYLERWFDSKFSGRCDIDAKRVVDSSKKTIGGFSSQWGLSMIIRFKATELPKTIADKSKDGKTINSLEFVWDLVENYGFRFSKTQDIDSILENVPAEHLEEFRLGLSA